MNHCDPSGGDVNGNTSGNLDDAAKTRKRRSFGAPAAEILRLDFSRLRKPASGQHIEHRTTERRRIVKRLIAIVREHRASARRVGSPLDDAGIGAVLRALRIESFGGDYQAILRHDDPVATWLRESLFQELLEAPSNILFTTQIDEETKRYGAMEAAFWRECLGELEAWVAPS